MRRITESRFSSKRKAMWVYAGDVASYVLPPELEPWNVKVEPGLRYLKRLKAAQGQRRQEIRQFAARMEVVALKALGL